LFVPFANGTSEGAFEQREFNGFRRFGSFVVDRLDGAIFNAFNASMRQRFRRRLRRARAGKNAAKRFASSAFSFLITLRKRKSKIAV